MEILSPGDTRGVLSGKLRDYCSVDVRECWVVSLAAQTVEVLRLTPGGEQSVAVYGEGRAVQSVAFPGFSVPVADVFAL